LLAGQETLYSLPNSFLLYKLAPATLILVYCYYAAKSLAIRKDKGIVNSLLLLSFVFLIYFIAGNFIATTTIKLVLITLLSFFPFYYWTNKGYTKISQLYLFLLFYIPTVAASYFFAASKLSFNVGEYVNNYGYSVLALLVVVVYVFWERKWVLGILAPTSAYLILLSGKRGAIVALAVVILIFAFFYLKQNKSRLLLLFFSILFITVSGITIYNSLSTNEFVLSRYTSTMQGSSSGRDIIYENLWNFFLNQKNFTNVVFGNGHYFTMKITGNVAHNDWLEILISMGLFGFVIYLSLFLSVVKFAFKTKLEIREKCFLYMMISVWLLTSLYSMFLYTMTYNVFFIVFGYIIGKSNYMETKKLT
jgi:O-antigen ligase